MKKFSLRTLLAVTGLSLSGFPLSTATAQEAPTQQSGPDLQAAYSEQLKYGTDFKVNAVKVALVDSPNIQSNVPGKRSSSRNKASFLEVETDFGWLPPANVSRLLTHLEEISIRYYVLLNNGKMDPKTPNGLLLTGTSNHIFIPEGKSLFSVMYVTPRTLEKYFGGKAPSSLPQAVSDAGVEILYKGKVVASGSMKSPSVADPERNWWKNPAFANATKDGLLLNKDETPFGPINWDYYEQLKPKSAGSSN